MYTNNLTLPYRHPVHNQYLPTQLKDEAFLYKEGDISDKIGDEGEDRRPLDGVHREVDRDPEVFFIATYTSALLNSAIAGRILRLGGSVLVRSGRTQGEADERPAVHLRDDVPHHRFDLYARPP